MKGMAAEAEEEIEKNVKKVMIRFWIL